MSHIKKMLRLLEKKDKALFRAAVKISDLLGGKAKKLVLCTFKTDEKKPRGTYKAMVTKSQCQRLRDAAPDAQQIDDLLGELIAEFNVIGNEAAVRLDAALNPTPLMKPRRPGPGSPTGGCDLGTTCKDGWTKADCDALHGHWLGAGIACPQPIGLKR
jgi:hypothetical protein